MLKKSKLISMFSLLIFLLSSNLLIAANGLDKVTTKTELEETDLLKSAKVLYYKERTAFYNAEKDLDEIIKVLKSSKAKIILLNDCFDKFYYSGQVDFLIAEIYEVMGDQREAAFFFDCSVKNAKKAINRNSKSSDGYRLLADSYMRLMTYNGTMYMMTKGPQVVKLLKRSLSLDKENYKALNSLATYYINAPRIGGGSIDRGIKVLEESLYSENEFDNFISYIWLGQAYLKKDNRERAEISIKKALDIYPDSQWAGQIMTQIEGGK